MQFLFDRLVDPVNKSRVWHQANGSGERLLSARACYPILNGMPNMMVESSELEHYFGLRNFRSWRSVQDEAETSYATRTQGHFSVDTYAPAQDFGAIVSQFSGEWLDVGCGKLAWPIYMRAAEEIAFFGIDPMPFLVTRDFPFVRGLGDFLPFSEACFDGVMFASSLDHCIVPLQALEEAHRVLRPGGTLLVWETIRPDDVRFREWAASAMYFQARYNSRHNWGFTRSSLEFVVRRAGFEVIGWEKTSEPSEAVIVARRFSPS